MGCIFNIKTENRNCKYCTATICDEKQPKPVETFTTNKLNSMTDKIQKIRKEVERIQLYTQSEVLKQVLDYIDKVQEEPVELKIDKEKFRGKVERLKSNLVYGACSSQVAMETRCKEEAYNEVLAILDTMQEEPVSGLDNGDMPIERWKQAVKAASNQRNYRSSKGLTETRDDYFVDGVQWADEHPKKEHVSEEWIEWIKDNIEQYPVDNWDRFVNSLITDLKQAMKNGR